MVCCERTDCGGLGRRYPQPEILFQPVCHHFYNLINIISDQIQLKKEIMILALPLDKEMIK